MIDVGKVGMIPYSSIVVGERAREVMGDLDAMEANMRESGLITPLAVLAKEDGTYLLLAGERRYTVLGRNNATEVPVRIYEHELTDLEMKIIEKSENFHRKDMEYWELDHLTLEIHEMQQEVHGVKHSGPDQQGWGIKDTGDLIGGASKATVSQSIKRAEARDAFPELFDRCKTASDATKVLKKIDEAVIKQTIAQKIEAQKTDTVVSQLANKYIVKDFFKGVKEIPDGIMHLVEVDPPYAIDIKNAKMSEGESQYNLNDYNEIPVEDYQVFLANTFHECYRVMAQHSWLICWFAPEPWFEIVYQELNNAGFETSRMCGIWSKPYGQSKHPEIKLANSYEMFFYAWKGRPALNKPGRRNSFDGISPVPSQQKTHPTERPVELMQEVYDTFAFPSSRVLIPFLGSGNGILAAHNLNMSAIGFDLSKGHKDSFLVKLNNLK